MNRRRPISVSALAAVTVFVWSTRIPLAWRTTSGGAGAKVVPLATAIVFLVPAAALAWRIVTGKTTTHGTRNLTLGLAGWTILYWAVRLPVILANPHPVPFKVVHGVLGTASVVAAAAAWRWVAHRRAVGDRREPVAA